jgi:hypothetical protein
VHPAPPLLPILNSFASLLFEINTSLSMCCICIQASTTQ